MFKETKYIKKISRKILKTESITVTLVEKSAFHALIQV